MGLSHKNKLVRESLCLAEIEFLTEQIEEGKYWFRKEQKYIFRGVAEGDYFAKRALNIYNTARQNFATIFRHL